MALELSWLSTRLEFEFADVTLDKTQVRYDRTFRSQLYGCNFRRTQPTGFTAQIVIGELNRSRTGQKHKEHAAELGVNCFLGKPFQESELLENIDELVN